MKHIATNAAPEAIGPYSQAILANDLLYCSGQIPLSPQTGLVVGTDIVTQTEQVLANINAVLQAAGATFENVVKTTCFLASMADFAQFNELYGAAFSSKPARSTVGVNELPRGALVEIEVIAVVPRSERVE